ncbi:MAG: hypothetical protein KJ709_09615 [Nanoarchaeota archaeon]|nr:hypothetical protein [Nanoarchaeota archaeon]
MRIEFSKRLEGRGELEPYRKEYQRMTQSYRSEQFPEWDRELRLWAYDLGKLYQDFIQELSESFDRHEMPNQESSKDSLWVRSPHEFSLELKIQHAHGDLSPQYNSINNPTQIPKECWEKVGEREPKLDEETRQEKIPIYEEIPALVVKGEISYKEFFAPDPSPALAALNELGYDATVKPVTKDLRPIIEKLLREMKAG